MTEAYRLRPLLAILGALIGGAALVVAHRKRAGRPGPRWVAVWGRRIERRFGMTAAGLALGFFCAALAAKVTQWRGLELSGQDFWLFEDMFANLARGGFFVTRYAPQVQGFMQHGVVHPYFSLALSAPVTWVLGSLGSALVFGPLCFAAAGALLAAFARPRWGALGALALEAGFLGSSLVGRVVMYEVHPEAMYPVAAFFWAWAAGLGGGREGGAAGLRPWALLAATLVLAGIKIDGFLVLFPLLVVALLVSPPRSRGWLAVSAALGVGVMTAQFHAVSAWKAGEWGPALWDGLKVSLPAQGPALLGHQTWDGPASGLRIAGALIERLGGASGVLESILHFLVSRPFLSLAALAPWLLASGGFWLLCGPLLAALACLDMPSRLLVYYSAPLLAGFWIALTVVRPPRALARLSISTRAVWVLCASWLVGGAGLIFYRPLPALGAFREEVAVLSTCLPASGYGMISSRLLGALPELVRRRAWTDQVPDGTGPELSFMFFSTLEPSYELSLSQARELRSRLAADPRWREVGPGCATVVPREGEAPVSLFVRSR